MLYMLTVNAGKYGYSGRKRKYTLILGGAFSAMTACGFALDRVGSVPYANVLFLISVVLYARVFSFVLCMFWSFLEKAEIQLAADREVRKAGGKRYVILDLLLGKPWLCMAVLVVCWLPCYLSIFPGNFIYDATKEYNQVIQGYSGEFPLLHSVLITKLISAIYQWTGSYNIGIAVFVIGQMLLLAALFSAILRTFHKDGINSNVLYAMLGYYALFPVIHLLVTCSTRDVMFSGFIVYTMLMIYRMFRNTEAFFSKIRNPVCCSIVFALTILSRNNNAGKLGVVVVVLFGLLLFMVFRKRNSKGARVLLVVPLCSYILLSCMLSAACQPFVPAEKKSSLSIMTQPIVRAYSMYKEQWTEEEIQKFEECFYVNHLQYVDVNADSTKYYLNDQADMMSFLRFWLKIGAKYPGCYADAILANTRQMWFPDSVIDGYVKIGAYTSDKSYFYFAKHIEEPGTYEGKNSYILDVYQKLALDISFEKVPVISMLFSIGFMVWMVLNCCAYVMYRKAVDLYGSLSVILLYTVCSAFVPLVLLRYFSALYFAFPFIVIFMLQPMNGKMDTVQMD